MLKLAFDIFVYHFLLQPRLFSVSANFSGRRAREMTLLMSRRRRKSRFFLFFGRNRNWNWQMLTTGIVNGDLNNGMSWSFKISKPLLTCLQRECPGRLHLKYCELSRHFPSHSQTEGEGEMKPSQKPLYVLFSKPILTWEASLSPSGILTQGFHIYEIEG